MFGRPAACGALGRSAICSSDRRSALMSLCAGVQFLLWIFYTVCVFFREWMCACRTFGTVCHSMSNEATSVLVSVTASWNRLFNIITSVWTGFVSMSWKWNIINVTLWLKNGSKDGQKLKTLLVVGGSAASLRFFNRFYIFEEYMCCKLNKLSTSNTWKRLLQRFFVCFIRRFPAGFSAWLWFRSYRRNATNLIY